jgi:hypothetical protein
VLGLASLDSGQRESGEVGTAGLLGPPAALFGLKDAVRVHLALEAAQKHRPTVRCDLPGVALCM